MKLEVRIHQPSSSVSIAVLRDDNTPTVTAWFEYKEYSMYMNKMSFHAFVQDCALAFAHRTGLMPIYKEDIK